MALHFSRAIVWGVFLKTVFFFKREKGECNGDCNK